MKTTISMIMTRMAARGCVCFWSSRVITKSSKYRDRNVRWFRYKIHYLHTSAHCVYVMNYFVNVELNLYSFYFVWWKKIMTNHQRTPEKILVYIYTGCGQKSWASHGNILDLLSGGRCFSRLFLRLIDTKAETTKCVITAFSMITQRLYVTI